MIIRARSLPVPWVRLTDGTLLISIKTCKKIKKSMKKSEKGMLKHD